MKQIIPQLLLLSLLINSCTPEPKPISYGDDLCHFCKMNIVDQQHAAELVTEKGKVFTFDAIECLLNYKKKNEGVDFAYQLVNDFKAPKKLIDASTSYYLISKELPSPMGANLTAFATQEDAIRMRMQKEGQVFDWDKLQAHFYQE